MAEGVESGSEKELNSIKDIKTVVGELKAELTRLLDPIYEIPNAINKATAAAICAYVMVSP